jgi:L-ribulose-5-phosphate 4-epimerase
LALAQLISLDAGNLQVDKDRSVQYVFAVSENDYSNLVSAYIRFSMLLKQLREAVLDANLELTRRGLVLYTFGNVSGISREDGLVVIKPSGVPYQEMRPEHLVVTDLGGKIVEGELRPSSDLPTHLVLYNAFPKLGGVAHTHSEYATAWAQARRPIPCFGTTHADYFYGSVPVTEVMTDLEIAGDYEKNTGDVIVRAFKNLDTAAVPGILVANHGPFTWGKNAGAAAQTAVILEALARTAYFTLSINPSAEPVSSALRDKHYLRKHGQNAYYGQVKERG